MGEHNDPLLLLKSPFGDDTMPVQSGTLHAIRLLARERLSAPFEIELEVVSTEQSIDPDRLLRQPVCVTVRRRNGLDRFFHGLVRRVEALGMPNRGRLHYRLEVVPSLWFLAQTTDCRIFQQMTAVEILQILFAEHGVEPVAFRIVGNKPRREYTTQFNETDLDFVQRLMQEQGYFYFFEHAPSGHTLVVTDTNNIFKSLERPVHRVVHNGDNVDIFNTWTDAQRTAFGRVRLEDYDPTRPSTPVLGQRSASGGAAGAAERDMFRWPAMTTDNGIAADRARFRLEADEAAAGLREGHGFDPNLCPGFCFTLDRDPFTEAENIVHAIHGTTHRARDETWLGGTSPADYNCDFTCFLQSATWRDELSVPRPVMSGIFSAIVLGEEGEEIHADYLARVKVRPLFDHRKETVAGMAIWIRILHAWSGNKWGWQHLPRVGTEVGISFMNGDPDNPVVVGCFYHEEMRPVFDIPAEKTIQGFRSRSTLHGGTQEYNELSFDDARGRERVLLHAQKDLRIEVEHDRTVVTHHDDSLTSETGEITVTADAGSVTVTAAVSITLRVGATSLILSEAGIALNTPGVISLDAVGDVNVAAGGLVSVEAVGDINLAAVGAVSIEAVGDVNIAGSAVTIEALDGAVVCLPFPI